MERESLQWYKDNDCELYTKPLMGDPSIFDTIYAASNGDPCNAKSGCSCKDRCPAWKLRQQSQSQNNPAPSAPVESIKQIAERMGIGVREARRRRQAGEL